MLSIESTGVNVGTCVQKVDACCWFHCLSAHELSVSLCFNTCITPTRTPSLHKCLNKALLAAFRSVCGCRRASSSSTERPVCSCCSHHLTNVPHECFSFNHSTKHQCLVSPEATPPPPQPRAPFVSTLNKT